MPLFTAPILITPLLKIPLLLSHAVGTWQGMTPPQKPPSAKEQDKMNGMKESTPKTIWFCAIIKVSRGSGVKIVDRPDRSLGHHRSIIFAGSP